MSILVVGSIAYDSIETDSGKADDTLGGSGIHFSAASSLFSATRIVGVVGEDFRMEDLQFLRDRGVDMSGITVEKGKTFRWSGRYHTNMNDRDSLLTELNVFEHFRPRIPGVYRDSQFLFLANIHPELQREVLDQVDNPAFTALDTMNFWIDGNRAQLVKVLKRVDAVILNDSEALDFSGEQTIAKAARSISSFGPRIVVIKKGEHGCVMYHEDVFFSLPAFILESVVDPTGAGDSFAGGFMGYIASRNTRDTGVLRTALAYGTCVASLTCEAFGTQRLSRATRDEVDERLAAFRAMACLER